MSRRRLNPKGVIAGLWLVCGGLAAAVAVTVWWLGAPAPEDRSLAATRPGCTRADPCLALVIDDVGRDLDTLRRFVRDDLPLSFSVLPHARHTDASLALLCRHNREVMLHLPMRPQDTSHVTDEPVVVGMDGPADRATRLALARVPRAVGANNHMGSAVSLNPKIIKNSLEILHKEGLWFLDSRTVAGSRICAVARSLGMPCLERDLFADADPSAGSLARAVRRSVDLARRRGWAVVIAHNRPSTARRLLPALAPHRGLLVPLSRVISTKSDDYRRDLGSLDAT